MPIYLVEVPGTELPKRLVEAANLASARGHVARKVINAKVATTAELFAIAKAGGEVETVGGEVAEPLTTDVVETPIEQEARARSEAALDIEGETKPTAKAAK